ncbi:hypothetical protein N7445_006903, partial [Penicillium cf. griseofulvum]
ILSKTYAHHLARACWHGGRIVLRQTSPEAEGIFDFIIELHRACNGRWDDFRERGLEQEDLDTWLQFTGSFLSNLGNSLLSQNDGDRKSIPNVPKDALRKMAGISPEASAKLEEIIDRMTTAQPAQLGYPDKTNQSTYYPGREWITKEEIEAVTKLMETKGVAPENTRLTKHARGNALASENFHVFEILQASRPARVFLSHGDHAEEMAKICAELTEARKYALVDEEKTGLSQLIESFRTGDYKAFRSAHKTWVKDKAPRVEHCMGFLFFYRDPHGKRAEWLAVAGIAPPEETNKMKQLVEKSSGLIRTLPWAVPDENYGKGPFEPSEFDVPDFAIIHVLASVSSTVWEAMNITIDDDDGKRRGV